MVFTLKNKHNYKPEVFKILAKRQAKQIIALYKMGGDEVLVDTYLKNKYGLTLKLACYTILNNCKLMKNEEGNLVVVLVDKHLDRIASIINYGPDGHSGSDILRAAFKW